MLRRVIVYDVRGARKHGVNQPLLLSPPDKPADEIAENPLA